MSDSECCKSATAANPTSAQLEEFELRQREERAMQRARECERNDSVFREAARILRAAEEAQPDKAERLIRLAELWVKMYTNY